jgi:hypothetical protein
MNFILAAILAALLSGIGGYFYGVQVGKDRGVAEQARDLVVAAIATDAAASAVAALRPIHQTVRATLEKEIRENTVYHNTGCDTGPVSVRAFNSAIPGYVERAASGVVPTPNPTD